jgi:thiamine monophosphate synthase
LPTFAIGGITAGNLPIVIAAGIERAAVGAAVVNAEDSACAVSELSRVLNGTRPAAEAASPSQSLAPSSKF